MKELYLIIEEDHSVSFSDTLTRNLRARCRRGEISLIDTKRMVGMNAVENHEELGEYSAINTYDSEEHPYILSIVPRNTVGVK